MKTYSYDFEVKNAVAQFLDTLNDIIVKRRKGDKTQQVKVHAQLGDSSRTYKFLSNPRKTLVVPKLSVTMNNLTRDATRSSGINDHLTGMPELRTLTNAQLTNFYNRFYGTPVNIDFDVEIFTIYHEDLDQIMCNITAFCNPSFYVVTLHPKVLQSKFTKPVTIQHQVVWNGDFSLKMPFEVPKDTDYRYYANTKFTFKTWIWPGEGAWIGDPPHIIEKINFFPEIVGGEEDGVWTLSNWHAVPRSMEFEEYQENVVLGLIKRPYYDVLSLSGVYEISGGAIGTSGYWSDVSAMVSGDVYGSSINSVSGNPVYLVNADYDMLIFSTAEVLDQFMEEGLNLSAVIHKWETTGKV